MVHNLNNHNLSISEINLNSISTELLAMDDFEYQTKSSFLNPYEYKFLKQPIIVKLENTVRVLRCGDNLNNLCFGIGPISVGDKSLLKSYLDKMRESFPGYGTGLTARSLIPMDQNTMYLKANVNTYECMDKKATILDDIPNVSTCRLSLLLQGMVRSVDGELSYMARVHQCIQLPVGVIKPNVRVEEAVIEEDEGIY